MRPSFSAVDLAARLRAELTVSEVSLDHPIGGLTTYRVGGRADLYVDVRSVEDLDRTAAAIAEVGAPVLMIGLGSNMLVSDAGYRGVAIRLSDGFDYVDIVGETVEVGGGAPLPVVSRRTVKAGLTGFEWAVGVPGSIGGAVRMNAGGHGSDMAASLQAADVLDFSTGERSVVQTADLDLGYRTSAIASDQCVVAATLELAAGDQSEAQLAIGEIVRWRREHQPGGQNAGSVFTNPPDDSAGRLIDAAGLKGRRVGSAEVSIKHANFIQVDDGGRADDVFELMRIIADVVRADAQIDLEIETRLIGFPSSGPADADQFLDREKPTDADQAEELR